MNLTPKLGQKLKDDPKETRYTIRLNDEEKQLLEECAEQLGIKQSKVILMGIQMVHDSISQKEKD